MEEACGNGDADDADIVRLDVPVVSVAPDGDVVLEVLFEQSKETLKAEKQTPAFRRARHQAPVLERRSRRAYRVSSKVLIQQSQYFARLLGDEHFQEAQVVRKAHDNFKRQNLQLGDLDPRHLPWIRIEDDDEATHSVGREALFLDILRMLHKLNPERSFTTLRQLAVLAALADRFDCAAALDSGTLRRHLNVKWPLLSTKASDENQPLSTIAEEQLRQQIYVFWTIDVTVQPRLGLATRALIMHGSRLWNVRPNEHESHDNNSATDTGSVVWWDLPANLERELQFRRECILNTIASVPRHFLQLYSSRERQCKLGYDSSKACDSYQLGEMFRFLLNRRLLHLVDFGPVSLDAAINDQSSGPEIVWLIATLKRCPSYQVDKNHTNCGLRLRMLPILDYLQAMLSANVVAVSKIAWEKDRAAISWFEAKERCIDEQKRSFKYYRSLATDPRLMYEGTLAVDHFARELFTADAWDWTPEE